MLSCLLVQVIVLLALFAPVFGTRSTYRQHEPFDVLSDRSTPPVTASGRITAESMTQVLASSSARYPGSAATPASAEMQETFEGSWPTPGWQLTDQGHGDNGEYLWGKRNCHPRNGTYAGWSVGGGAQGSALDCAATYPNNARTWAVYGPFDLSQATHARLDFYLWGGTEGDVGCPFDLLYVGSSPDRTVFSGTAYCGDWSNGPDEKGYYRQTLDLRQRLGQRRVWIGFGFISDSNTSDIGITVDDIALEVTYPAATPTPTGQPAGGRINLPLVLRAGATPTLPVIMTATPTLTPTPTSTPTATPTAPANSGHFIGATSQGRVVRVDLLPGGALVGHFYIEYSITCPFMTQTGHIDINSPVGWPIANGQFEINAGAGGGATNRLTGQFNATMTTLQGTWLIWAVVYDPTPRPVCSNTGTWTATQQP